jgi:hypothetical protein
LNNCKAPLFISGRPRQPAHNGPHVRTPFLTLLPCLACRSTAPTSATPLLARDPHRLHTSPGTGLDPPPPSTASFIMRRAGPLLPSLVFPLLDREATMHPPFCFPPRPRGTSQDGSHRHLPQDTLSAPECWASPERRFYAVFSPRRHRTGRPRQFTVTTVLHRTPTSAEPQNRTPTSHRRSPERFLLHGAPPCDLSSAALPSPQRSVSFATSFPCRAHDPRLLPSYAVGRT